MVWYDRTNVSVAFAASFLGIHSRSHYTLYHPAVDKSIINKTKKTPSTNFVAVLYMDHTISCATFFSHKYGNAGNGVYVFETHGMFL